jgi:hypothetical protein
MRVGRPRWRCASGASGDEGSQAGSAGANRDPCFTKLARLSENGQFDRSFAPERACVEGSDLLVGAGPGGPELVVIRTRPGVHLARYDLRGRLLGEAAVEGLPPLEPADPGDWRPNLAAAAGPGGRLVLLPLGKRRQRAVGVPDLFEVDNPAVARSTASLRRILGAEAAAMEVADPFFWPDGSLGLAALAAGPVADGAPSRWLWRRDEAADGWHNACPSRPGPGTGACAGRTPSSTARCCSSAATASSGP